MTEESKKERRGKENGGKENEFMFFSTIFFSYLPVPQMRLQPDRAAFPLPVGFFLVIFPDLPR